MHSLARKIRRQARGETPAASPMDEGTVVLISSLTETLDATSDQLEELNEEVIGLRALRDEAAKFIDLMRTTNRDGAYMCGVTTSDDRDLALCIAERFAKMEALLGREPDVPLTERTVH